MKEYLPRASFTIGDLDTLKAFADPLRHQILEALTHETLPVRQIAAPPPAAGTHPYALMFAFCPAFCYAEPAEDQ